MNKVSTVSTMTLDGGAVCLDFVNSGYDREKDVIVERLHTFEDLLTLTGRLQLFSEAVLNDFKKQASANEVEARRTLNAARRARELLYRLFAGLAQRQPGRLAKQELAELNRLFARAMQFKIVTVEGNGLQFSFQPGGAGLMAPVWRLVLSARDLLEGGNLQYIRQCQRCAWLFVDKTKNHRKKWCSMESCGNSQKSQRYYLHKKTP